MKKRTLNEYRQTKEYKLSDQGGDYTVPHKGAEPKAYKDLAGDPDLIESVKEMIASKIVITTITHNIKFILLAVFRQSFIFFWF